MSNSLDQDFEEFRFSDQNKICKDDAVDDLQKFGMFFLKYWVKIKQMIYINVIYTRNSIKRRLVSIDYFLEN